MNINLRRYSELELPSAGVGIEGWVEMELIHARSGLVVQSTRFKNMLMNSGLNQWIAGTSASVSVRSATNHCAVGSGSAAPDPSQVALGNELGRSNSDGGVSTTETHVNENGQTYVRIRIARFFSESQANGNLTEVAFFNATTGGNMWMRQLIKDGNGNPTAITKTSDFQLRVVYELRFFFNLNDVVRQATINGVAMDVTTRPSYWGSSSTNPFDGQWDDAALGGGFGGGQPRATDGVLGAVTAEPSGSGGSSTSTASVAYISGDRFRDYTVTWGPAVANFVNGIRCIRVVGPRMAHQHQFSAAQIKNDTQRFVANLRFEITPL